MVRNTYTSLGYYTYDELVDWDGNPIKKTPSEYPYSYDAYVIHKAANDYQHTVYSDRLVQWDYDKYNRLSRKHFGDESQYWDRRDKNDIESFLGDYLDKPNLELIGIMKGCNVSSGYPYWIFFFNEKNSGLQKSWDELENSGLDNPINIQ